MLASAACATIFLLVHRSLKTPFFLYMLAAVTFIACASVTAAFTADPASGALHDIFLALCGAGMAAASLQLAYSFRLAGDGP